jgi:hypothetical protein
MYNSSHSLELISPLLPYASPYIAIFGYLDLIESKNRFPEVWQIPPKKPCVYTGDVT